MSKIDELIQEFCPNGVKFLQLGDVAQILNGYSFKSGKYSESGIRVVRISDVQKGKMSDKDLKFYPLEYEAEISRYLLRENDLVMSLTGNVGRVAMLSKADLPAGLNQRVACIRPSEVILTRWLFHFLDTDTFESDAMKNSTGGGQKNMSTVWLSKYKIPVPPLEVQKEIVNILDKFTQLEAELSAELEARRKQYEYYRSQLVGKNVFVSENWVSLESVSTIKTGTKPKVIEKIISGIPYINAGNEPSGYTNDRNTDGGVITIPSRGQGSAGHVGWQEEAFWCGPLCYRVDSRKTVILNKFLYYYLKNIQNQIVELRKVGSIPAVNKSDLGKVMIPVPPILQQERIISILDNFDALVNDISAGLPAEINARRQQYEYYRTKLLTFQESQA